MAESLESLRLFRSFYRAIRFALPERRAVLLIVALTLLIAGANAAGPLILKLIFDGTHAMTVGTVIAFIGYVGALFGPVQGLSTAYQSLSKASVSLEEIVRILPNQEYLGDSPHAVGITGVRGEVRFECGLCAPRCLARRHRSGGARRMRTSSSCACPRVMTRSYLHRRQRRPHPGPERRRDHRDRTPCRARPSGWILRLAGASPASGLIPDD